MSWNEDWEKNKDYPAWGDNDIYKKTINYCTYVEKI